MRGIYFTLAFSTGLFGTMGSVFAASPICADRATVIEKLGANHHEAPVHQGLTTAGDLIEVLVTADGSTFTLIISEPGGRSCLLAAGKDWTDVFVDVVPEGPQT